jgi:hypothetical protein
MNNNAHSRPDDNAAHSLLSQAALLLDESRALSYAVVMALAQTPREELSRDEIDGLCQLIPAAYAARAYVEAGGLVSYGLIRRIYIASFASMSAVFSKAPSQTTFQSCSPPSSSWSSTFTPPERSASKCRRPCSPAPTR